ncbi:branched-chain amino acid ABC transporter permease [Roseiarcaceae bacterium H3SJ34-1]|uniref:branched-chain amino acid ABC transporter permease n=1 Tax=Terripilifer ovatus TaxID=3032367 RepID=UPI003AB97321|nr:branched-chain amino acid ABC transporter permease [Roseiarcaceae bacterium H3SJ34-1]
MGEFVFFLLALAWPFLAGSYGTGLITEALIFAIAAMSLDLLMGYSGLVSFGHAAFFGVGAYALALSGMKLGLNPWLGILVAVMTSALAALIIGYFCVRVSGVAFIMLTLAFAQLLYSAAVKWRGITGGSDGIGGFDRPQIAGLSLNDPIYMYFACLLGFVLSLWLLRRIINSQFGHALVGLRENETRMRALGFSTDRLKLCAFVLSGAFAGFAGALYAIYNSFISPDALSFAQSGMFLLMVVLGGVGSLLGPAIGAAIFLLMKQFVSSHTEHWLAIVGIIFVCCVMFFRSGVYGFLKQWLERGART